MIDELQVRDYALIADANLEFAPGCTVLTGETGAGKTALTGALKLLIGERADSLLIRDGASELRVSARLSTRVGDTATAGATDTETVVSRRLNRQGRSRCTLDDELVTVATLAESVGPGFELLGQHEHQSLLSPAAQLDYLDSFGGTDLAAAWSAYTTALAAAGQAQLELHSLEEAAHSDARRLDDARFLLQSIERVNPQPGELEDLELELPILRAGEDLAAAVDAALVELRADDAALERLALATNALAHVQNIDQRLDNLKERLASLSIDLEDLTTELREYRELVGFDAEKLEATLDRLGALEGLRKRFGPRMEDVFAARGEALENLQRADNLPALIAAAKADAVAADTELAAAATTLTTFRHAAAAAMRERLNVSLTELAMQGASIDYAFNPLERGLWTAAGPERFELLYKVSEKSLARPLARIASGGELSRLMLALKTEIGQSDAKTLVFDEVDAGIGGAAAQAVAAFLTRLSKQHQVIIVTHLAQIAVIADRHYLVEKTPTAAGLAETSVRLVGGDERVREIARMLSGEDSAVARSHAAELLAAANAASAAAAATAGNATAAANAASPTSSRLFEATQTED